MTATLPPQNLAEALEKLKYQTRQARTDLRSAFVDVTLHAQVAFKLADYVDALEAQASLALQPAPIVAPALSKERLLELLQSIDPTAVRLPPGFEMFARAVESDAVATAPAMPAELIEAARVQPTPPEPFEIMNRAIALHENTRMPWREADALALSEYGIDDAAIQDSIDDAPSITSFDGDVVVNNDDMMAIARHLIVRFAVVQASGETAPMTAEQALAAQGIFKGAEGLRGLAECNEFWDEQMHGTRLNYGPDANQYLHRDVLRAAIVALDGGAAK